MKLTSKDIHIAIKNQKTVEDLVREYGFSDATELFEEIHVIMPLGSREAIKKLQKIQKRSDRRMESKMRANNFLSEVADVEIQIHEVPDEEEIHVHQEQELQAEESQVENPKANGDLEQLKQDEEMLSKMLCELEGNHKEMVAERGRIMYSLQNSKSALQELQRLLHVQEQRVTSLCEEYNDIACMMQANNREQESCREMLTVVRESISELEIASIFVFEDGTIEVENADIPSISEEKILSGVNNLIQQPEAEEFTIKELKTIAKLQAMVQAFKEGNHKFELSFGSLQVQKFFETVA